MKNFVKIFCFLFCFCTIFSTKAQTKYKIPFFKRYNAGKLTHFLTDNDTLEHQKAFKIFDVLTQKISFDHKNEKYSIARKPRKPNAVLRRGKATAQNYTNLFKNMCDTAGIKCFVVQGYAKTSDYEPNEIFYKPNQFWNLAKLDGTWCLIDPINGCGHFEPQKQTFKKLLYKHFGIPYLRESKFVKMQHLEFFNIHPLRHNIVRLPIFPPFQLMNCPITMNEFTNDDETERIVVNNINMCGEHFNASSITLDAASSENEFSIADVSFRFNSHNHHNICEVFLKYGKSQLNLAENFHGDSAIIAAVYHESMRYLELADSHATLYQREAINFYNFKMKKLQRYKDSVLKIEKHMEKNKNLIKQLSFERQNLKKENKFLKKTNVNFQTTYALPKEIVKSTIENIKNIEKKENAEELKQKKIDDYRKQIDSYMRKLYSYENNSVLKYKNYCRATENQIQIPIKIELWTEIANFAEQNCEMKLIRSLRKRINLIHFLKYKEKIRCDSSFLFFSTATKNKSEFFKNNQQILNLLDKIDNLIKISEFYGNYCSDVTHFLDSVREIHTSQNKEIILNNEKLRTYYGKVIKDTKKENKKLRTAIKCAKYRINFEVKELNFELQKDLYRIKIYKDEIRKAKRQCKDGLNNFRDRIY